MLHPHIKAEVILARQLEACSTSASRPLPSPLTSNNNRYFSVNHPPEKLWLGLVLGLGLLGLLGLGLGLVFGLLGLTLTPIALIALTLTLALTIIFLGGD